MEDGSKASEWSGTESPRPAQASPQDTPARRDAPQPDELRDGRGALEPPRGGRDHRGWRDDVRVRGVRGGGARTDQRARCTMCRKTVNLRNGTESTGSASSEASSRWSTGGSQPADEGDRGLTGLSPGTVWKSWRRFDAMGRVSSRGWTQWERSRSEGMSHRRGR